MLEWDSEDSSSEVREALVKNQEDDSSIGIVRVRDAKDSEWRDLVTFPYGEDSNLVDFFVDDGTTCLMTSSPVWVERRRPFQEIIGTQLLSLIK